MMEMQMLLDIPRPTYPASGDPRDVLAQGQRPVSHYGTLANFVPGFEAEVTELAPPTDAERALHRKLAKQFVDTHDAMAIPQAAGAHDLAKLLADRLYDRHSFKMRLKIPHSQSNAVHPGAVLIAAISQLALVLHGNPTATAPFAIDGLRDLNAWLGGYCRLFPCDGDLRGYTVHALHALVLRLLAYYA